MKKIDLDQDLVRAVSRNIPCIHMNTDFLAANAISVFLKYLNHQLESGSTLQEAIDGIKTKDVE
jgi:hypothetical protein